MCGNDMLKCGGRKRSGDWTVKDMMETGIDSWERLKKFVKLR